MAPRHRPWWRVDADADESEKLSRLPSDSARWAWFRMGCHAKTQRRMGIFAGRGHLATLIGSHARYIRDLVSVGVLHDWPYDCERCQKDYPDAEPGDLVAHDYRRLQQDPTNAERQDRYRNADSNGPSNADSNGEITIDSRALSRSPYVTSSTTRDREPYQVGSDPPDDSDALISWLALNHHVVIRPGNGWHVRMMQWLAQGATLETAKAALTTAVEAGNRIDRQVIPAAEDLLFPRSATMTREERVKAEREAVIAKYGRRT